MLHKYNEAKSQISVQTFVLFENFNAAGICLKKVLIAPAKSDAGSVLLNTASNQGIHPRSIRMIKSAAARMKSRKLFEQKTAGVNRRAGNVAISIKKHGLTSRAGRFREAITPLSTTTSESSHFAPAFTTSV
jgi:hypothetical protein